jgi:glycosyltransferase involved in cell wall biosynthesis
VGRSGAADGVDVRRLPGLPLRGRTLLVRALDDLIFLAVAGWRAFRERPRPEILVAAASPPMLGLLAALVARVRRVPLVLWTMDVYPEAVQAEWPWTRRGAVGALLRVVARWQAAPATAVVVLGEDMASLLRAHVRVASVVTAVPVWSDVGAATPASVAALRTARGWEDGELVFLYSGNMGRGHRIGEFLEAARRLGPSGPVWAFLGGGAKQTDVERFRRQHASARIQSLPYVSEASLGASLRSADIHLVSLSTPWRGIIVPSKLPAAFAVGRPVLFVGPRESELARWVEGSGAGWAVAEDDIDALLAAVDAARDPEERRRRGEAAAEFGRRHFDRTTNRERIADLIERAALGPSPSIPA